MIPPLERVVPRLDRSWRIMAGMFLEQRQCFWRPLQNRVGTQIRAALTTRRAGKTWGAIGMMLTMAEMFPGSHYRYVMLTRDQTRDVVWPIAREMIDLYDIDAKILDDALKIRLSNNSMIHGYGADKKGWMSRARGLESHACVIDEAGEFSRPEDLEELVHAVLRPTLTKPRGTIWLIGTPGLFKTGMFYDATATDQVSGLSVGTGRIHGWKVFNWGMAHNPHCSEQYFEEIAQIQREHPGRDIMQIPRVLREYFGRWVEDDRQQVYEIDPTRNRYNGPWRHKDHPDARFVCGVDLGWNDATAFCVGAFEPHTKEWVVLESQSRSEAPLQWAVDVVKKYEKDYPGIHFVCDPMRKQLMMELQTRADIFVEPAEKHDKSDWISLVNRDFRAGDIKIVNFDTSLLVKEAVDLRWVRRPSGKVEEAPGQKNDVCDAHLYAYRRARHFIVKPVEDKPKKGTPEYWEDQAKRMRRSAIERQKRRQHA